MQEIWIPFAIATSAVAGVLIAGAIVVFVVLKTNKASAKHAVLLSRIGILETPRSRDAVFALLKGTSLGRFKVADVDDEKKVLVFQSGLTAFSWGFFFPVFLTSLGSGTRIDAGIKSRFLQYGPIVTKTHREFMAELDRALRPDSAVPYRLAA